MGGLSCLLSQTQACFLIGWLVLPIPGPHFWPGSQGTRSVWWWIVIPANFPDLQGRDRHCSRAKGSRVCLISCSTLWFIGHFSESPFCSSNPFSCPFLALQLVHMHLWLDPKSQANGWDPLRSVIMVASSSGAHDKLLRHGTFSFHRSLSGGWCWGPRNREIDQVGNSKQNYKDWACFDHGNFTWDSWHLEAWMYESIRVWKNQPVWSMLGLSDELFTAKHRLSGLLFWLYTPSVFTFPHTPF